MRRARMLAVLGLLASGGIGTIASTQTWIEVILADAGDPLQVSGADALPLLAPLSLAVLALGAALSIAGNVLRQVIGALGLAAAVVLISGTVPLLSAPPISSVAPALTEATGISGDTTLSGIVDALEPTAWPMIAIVVWTVLALASVLILATAHRWQAGGRRYRQSEGAAPHSDAEPLDPIDSWDELSQGTDPTGSSR